MCLSHYKSLYRRVTRLPLDQRSIKLAKSKLREQFRHSKKVQAYSVVNRKLYDHAITVMDSILVDEKYKEFHGLLDLIYRNVELSSHTCGHISWVNEFRHMRYGLFKSCWPQVHLINEFGDSKSCKLYHDVLKERTSKSEFLFMSEMNGFGAVDSRRLAPLNQTGQLDLETLRSLFIVEKIFQFQKFVRQNQSMLLETKIRSLEVFYNPTSYGLPPSISKMEAQLKSQVNYARKLLEHFIPIGENDLRSLIEMVTSKDPSTNALNPNFFRYMLRKRSHEDNSISSEVRKYVRHKQLIPNTRNILFHYREYVVRQFYITKSGKFCMSPMKNIYE